MIVIIDDAVFIVSVLSWKSSYDKLNKGSPLMSELIEIWGPLRSILRERYTAHRIIQILGLSSFNMEKLVDVPITRDTDDKNKIMKAVDEELFEMDEVKKQKFITALIEEMLAEKPEMKSEIEPRINRMGWKLYNNSPIPMRLFDTAELADLPLNSHSDLTKAIQKLRDGDLSGAISSACGAVDAVTSNLYVKFQLGDDGQASFQERIKVSLKHLNVFSILEHELISLGWDTQEAKMLKENYQKSINGASYVLGSFRRNMGDVHGTKPVLKAAVYDSLKWASLILRLLNSRQ